MSLDTLFNENSKLKHFKLLIDDFDIGQDNLLSLTIANTFLSFGLSAVIIFRDQFSIINSQIRLNENTLITFEVNDTLGDYKKYIFRVVNTEISNEESRANFVKLYCIDPIAYTFKNLYLAKSFNTDVCTAFKSIFQEYKCNKYLSSMGLKLDCVPCSVKKSFTWSSNLSAYDFFKEYSRLSNVRIWYDSEYLHIKEFDLQSEKSKYPLKLKGHSIQYTDTCSNNDYLFKIHQYKKDGLNHSQLMELVPSQEVIRFKGKSVNRETVNLTDFYKSLILNNNEDFSTFQNTQGKRSKIIVDSVEAQKHDLFSAFMNLNKLNIVVAGTLKYNCPGFIASVKLADKSAFKKQQLSGDITTSGNYLILGTESRFIKGHFHQMLALGRFDKPASKG